MPADNSEQKTIITAGGVMDPRFQVQKRLGSGGMGDVYLAEDSKLRRLVAIKTVRTDLCKNAEIRKRIERECLLHARVGAHPHIVTLYDKLETGDDINLVMEYVDGKSLAELLRDHRRDGTHLSQTDAVEIAAQCLEALAWIHAQGIVHRDIKPDNILITYDDSGRVCAKLMDFGIARLDDPDEQMTALTAVEGASPGTPVYMAPEQIDPKTYGAVSPATDIYAVGVMLYQLLTGTPPFSGSLTEVFRGHLTSIPPALKVRGDGSIPAPFVQVLSRALAKQPRDRFPSAKTFRETLQHSATHTEQRTLTHDATGAQVLGDGRTALAGPAADEDRNAQLPASYVAERAHLSPWPIVMALIVTLLIVAVALAAGVHFLRPGGTGEQPATGPTAPEKPVEPPGPASRPEQTPPAPSANSITPAPQPPAPSEPNPPIPSEPPRSSTHSIPPEPPPPATPESSRAPDTQPVSKPDRLNEDLPIETPLPEEPKVKQEPPPAPALPAAKPKKEPAPEPQKPPKQETIRSEPLPPPEAKPTHIPAPEPALTPSPDLTPAPKTESPPPQSADWAGGVSGGAVSSQKK